MFLTNEGYEQLKSLLEKKKKEFLSNSEEGAKACYNAVGDGWHDNFDAEYARQREFQVSYEIEKLLNHLKEAVLVSDEKSPYLVSINDIVKIKMDEKVLYVKLTGKYMPEEQEDYEEITLNSPLGSMLYQRPIPSTFTLNLPTKAVTVNVLEKRSL